MNIKIIFFAALIIVTTGVNTLKAWDTTAAKYYPLNTGNVYVFDKYDLWFSCFPHELQARYYVRITNTTVMPNGKTYYYFSGWWNLYGIGSPSWNYQRIDSSSMNVYAYDSLTNGEFLLDSLNGAVNNYFKCARLNYIQPFGWYERNDQLTIFNSSRIRRQFQCSGPIIAGTYYYLAEGIGFTGYSICELESGEEYKLRGCVIGGIVYGDTSLTSVSNSGKTESFKYSLEQNYPNPFNPETVIDYTVPASIYGDDPFVKLTIYDIAGKEVYVLVNEKKSPGKYSVKFNAGELSGGVYFYKLNLGRYTQTKSMIFVK